MRKLIRKHENSKKRYSVAKESQRYTRELKLEDQEELFIYLFIYTLFNVDNLQLLQ